MIKINHPKVWISKGFLKFFLIRNDTKNNKEKSIVWQTVLV